jgi:hypothetical protein
MILISKQQHNISNLESLQSWLRWIITDPRGVSDALKIPNPNIEKIETCRFKSKNEKKFIQRYQRPSVDCLPLIEYSSDFDREDRLTIYAEAYFARISDSLAEDFSSVKRLVGEEGFLQLVSDYLKEYPSRFENLAEVGYAFSNFLSLHEVSEFIPYIADLANLEWLLIESFYAPDGELLNWETVREISPETWKNARFNLNPSVRLMHSSWSVDRFWSKEENQIQKQSRKIMIFRKEGNVAVSSILDFEFQALQKITSNHSLIEICMALEDTAEEISLEQIERRFSEWLQDGIINQVRY